MTEPTRDEELDSLYAEYDALKPRVDALTERLDAVKQAIKIKETSAHAGERSITIRNPNLATPLLLIYAERWRIDTKRMKEEAPELYVKYAVKGGRWELREAP